MHSSERLIRPDNSMNNDAHEDEIDEPVGGENIIINRAAASAVANPVFHDEPLSTPPESQRTSPVPTGAGNRPVGTITAFNPRGET